MDALTALRWALRRDLMIALRRKADALQVLGFFVLAAALFPLAIGPQREWLQRIGPGAIWVCALLAVLLALPRLFESDHADGTLESMLASGQPLAGLMAGKMLAAWLVSGAPLVVVSPVLALSFDLPGELMPLLMRLVISSE